MHVVNSLHQRMYRTDEFGIKNYKKRWMLLMAIVPMVAIILLMSALCFYVEYGVEGSKIATFGDAFWLMWMASSTIGFGDIYPVTTVGRAITGFMVLPGMVFLGGLAAIGADIAFGFMNTSVKNRELKKQNADILDMLKEVNTSMNTQNASENLKNVSMSHE